jgi:hypothetical protein
MGSLCIRVSLPLPGELPRGEPSGKFACRLQESWVFNSLAELSWLFHVVNQVEGDI